jgi:hypothetical protein
MPGLEFGLRRGLAVDLQYDQRIADLRYNEQEDRRVTSEKKAQAKMLADDFSYNNAMNEHDNPLVKEFAQLQIRKIGTYVNSNPDWETNVTKRAEYTQLVRELKDNKALNRGLASDEGIKAYTQYSADPANAGIRNTPEYQASAQQYNNYIKFGNQYANSAEEANTLGKKAFVFQAPEELVSTNKYLVDSARLVAYDINQSFGVGGLSQSISQSRKEKAVENAIADSKWGHYLKKDYNNYVNQLNDNEKTSAKNINEFTLERMEPYFNSKKIDKGFKPTTIKSPGAGGMNPGMWTKMHVQAMRSKGSRMDFNPQAMDETFANENGKQDLNKVVDPFGNYVDLGFRKGESTGGVTISEENEANREVEVLYTIEDLYNLGDTYQDVIDEGGLGQVLPGGPSNESTSWEIHEEFRNKFERVTDEKGRAFIKFIVNKSYNPNNVNLADNYSNAHNVSPHKEEVFDSNSVGGAARVVVQNGVTFILNESTGEYEAQ